MEVLKARQTLQMDKFSVNQHRYDYICCSWMDSEHQPVVGVIVAAAAFARQIAAVTGGSRGESTHCKLNGYVHTAALTMSREKISTEKQYKAGTITVYHIHTA